MKQSASRRTVDAARSEREGASEGIYEFCETQYIAADW